MHGREREAPARFQPLDEARDEWFVERDVLGQNTDRIHEIESRGLEPVGEQIALDERHRRRANPIGVVRTPCFLEHGGRRIEADEASDTGQGPEIPAGSTSQIQHVDGWGEHGADAAQPIRKLAAGRARLELFVVGAIPFRVRMVVKRRRALRPRRVGAHANSSSAGTNRTSEWRAA